MTKELNNKLIDRYSRQIILKEVGPLGQKKIISSKILIVGAGALSCYAIDHLVRAGVGEICIVDDDKVSISNIHRQSFYNLKDINKFKVDVLKKKINLINSNAKIKIFKTKINKKNIRFISKDYKMVIDGSDNFKTKFLLNEFCLISRRKLIVGAISKFDGHIFSFNFYKKNIPCLKCFYQTLPSDEVMNCEADGVVGPIAGLVGAIQANEAIKTILDIGDNFLGKIIIINLLSNSFRTRVFSKKKNCIC